MRTEGAGKGDQLRYGVDWRKYGKNFDRVFRKRKQKRGHWISIRVKQ